MINLALTVVLIYVFCVIGMVWAVINYFYVRSIRLHGDAAGGEYISLSGEDRTKVDTIVAIGQTIAKVTFNFLGIFLYHQGANAFLFQEYKIMAIFSVVAFVIIKVTSQPSTS